MTDDVRTTAALVAMVVVPAVLTGACIAEDASGRDVVDRERRGDTLLVRNGAITLGDTAVLREVARIGRAQGPEELLLSDVSAFLELRDGRVVVADASGLRIFSAEGEFLERLARTGEGPGEVEFVTGMDVTADGRLLVSDLGNRRVNIYDTEADALDHWPLPRGMPGYGRSSIVATEDGSVFVAYNPPLPRDGSPIRYPRPVFLELGPDGTVADTVYAPERLAEACPTRSTAWWRAGYYEDVRVRYFPKVKWALGPDGTLAVGCPAGYELELIRPDGPVVRVSRTWEPVTVSDEERRSFVEGQTLSRNRSGYFESWSWRGEDPPGHKPAYQRFVFGRKGRIWVWPSQPSRRVETSERGRRMGAPPAVYRVSERGAFDVFARSGEYVGAVRLPEDVPYRPVPGRLDPFIRGDTIWALLSDALDVTYVTKYAVEWPGGAEEAREAEQQGISSRSRR